MEWVTFSARTGPLLWFAMQAWLVVEQLAGTSDVAAVAHLGGALVGVGAWMSWRDRPR
jgi:membrane associated rhomboid family serine protease